MSSESAKRKAELDVAAPDVLRGLRLRAELLEKTRRFFSSRGVLEVETPLLSEGLIVEAHIDPIACVYHPGGHRAPDRQVPLYLQPSPEAFMKRLLAMGSGSIYQITRAFRDGERGRLHNPEFTILEWYRLDCDHLELMDEVGELMRELLGVAGWEKRSYREVFEEIVGIDPLGSPTSAFPAVCDRHGIPVPVGLDEGNRNGWLDLFVSTMIEPRLGHEQPVFIYDYPPSQAALAKIGGREEPIAERFELYIRGVELCNGFHELQDSREHRLRFEESNIRRSGLGKGELPVDKALLASLDEGLPSCAGVAVGFDRVVLLAAGAETIDDVLPFPFRDDHREV